MFLCTDEDRLMFPKKYTNIILYVIIPRLDNLLLKTFGVAVKVPNFSFCCLSFLLFQMWFQLHAGFFLWSSNDRIPLTVRSNEAQTTLCNLVCVQTEQTGGLVDHCAVMSKSVHITFSSRFFDITCSNLWPMSLSLQFLLVYADLKLHQSTSFTTPGSNVQCDRSHS